MYDGINSVDMKMMNVSMSASLYEEPFAAQREIKEIKIRGRNKPYFQEIEKSPLTLNLNFAFTETWDDDLMHRVKSWLLKDYYKPMIFSQDLDKIYYCVCVSEPKTLHNGLKEGYCTLEFRCDSSYAYSPVYTFQYDLSVNSVNGTIKTINNLGNVDCLPYLQFQKIGDGSGESNVSITNLSNSSIISEFTVSQDSTISGGIVDDETVTVDSERQSISTDLTAVYRYDVFNGTYLYLVPGNNRLLIKGNAIFTFQMQYLYD
jgi:predicted phage tail component-like protein